MKNGILSIILIVIVGMVAFWYLGKEDNQNNYLSAQSSSVESMDARYIYDLLQKMATVELKDEIFRSSAFTQLKDNTVSFTPQTAGRANPFSPVGTDAGAVEE